ncbi:MAG: YqcC family protein [Chitinophagaceae bacterium]|nr:YqcC family protein [Chitinophagaceae bacterium]MBL0336560.1 YqcC family protein [Chitinophagaceae bacterium]MBL0336624.1 YqcC family protein [Chitinophagaceae bacterium]
MVASPLVLEKVKGIIHELNRLHLWKKQMPQWVTDFSSVKIMNEEDFSDWLQFVYLPNLMQLENRSNITGDTLIVPQAMKFFGNDVRKGKLLQLLIELDALL